MNKNNFILIIVLMSIIFTIVVFRLYNIIYIDNDYYQKKFDALVNKVVEGTSAPRGRILDCNGKIIVDNVGIKTIVYNKLSGISLAEEIEIAYELAHELELTKSSSFEEQKQFWILLYPEESDRLITEDEYKALSSRKLTIKEIYNLKKGRITPEMLDVFDITDKNAAYIYSLMNKGYLYEPKILKIKPSEEEYAKVLEMNLPGIIGSVTWDREYPYGDTLRSILGTISGGESGIPLEDKQYYLDLGYSLNERVGISYLEKVYETYLRGTKAKYKIKSDNTLTMLEREIRGNDLYLTIDIGIQLGIEEIIKDEIVKGKKLHNTEYFNHSYVLIGDPSTGGLVAASGLQLLQSNTTNTFKEITSNIINSSYTVGSVVKGASMSVGYMNNIIDIGQKYYDSCVKLYFVPQKCSFKPLGMLDDITALKQSSNYYQFMIAIGITGNKYQNNMTLNANEKHFDIYRNVFSDYGLGTLTGIDLPNEQEGIQGTTIADDLLLNLSIGQYDTYTPVQLLQYINTIANNGSRIQLQFLKEIKDINGNVLLNNEHKILNKVDMEDKYYSRIKEGFYQVVNYGTGRGYTNTKYRAAGKTGTSESFIDTNSDGIMDTKTITSSYAMFAPYDNPEYSMVVVTPNVSHYGGNIDYMAGISRYISREVSNFLFE